MNIRTYTFLLLFFSLATAQACDCQQGTIKQNIAAADVIFSGEAVLGWQQAQAKAFQHFDGRPSHDFSEYINNTNKSILDDDAALAIVAEAQRVLADPKNSAAKLKVIRIYKGNVPQEVLLNGGIYDSGCQYMFEQDQQYLVYANYDDNNKSGVMFAGVCSGSKLLIDAYEDVQALIKNL